MGLIVVDASVAVKWIIAEPGDAEALAILNGGDSLISPDLVCVEVAGAISRRARDERFSLANARHAYTQWVRLLDQQALNLKSSEDLVDRAFAMALEARHPVADCIYLACAEALGATVLTADHAMFDRGRRVYDRIELLTKAA